ncbi:hypothetical protein Gogos_010775 [Gossypium gossypioides]|uniref:MalT-like TPR region domain-containing protein n=1 Tax=Gossypium gossypioides TaxID=34282 RepID=A0A7J9BMI4_GOSGO|nr:hypothetical protein [Gossypium gossypioides]
MKKASNLLLSKFNRQRSIKAAPLLSRAYISENSPSSSSSSSQFHSTGRHRKLREKSDLEEAFESGKTSGEMFRVFKDMEACFDERELGIASLKIGLKLDREGEDPEKALSFADRALKVLDQDGKPSLLVAVALQLMGSVSYGLKRFNDSLGYLNKANRLLGRLEEEGIANVENIRPLLHAVQLELGNVKTAMGRREEALLNFKKALEIKEMTLGKDSKELGVGYRDLAEAYVSVLNFKEALPFGLKTLEIHRKGLGHNSVEVAHDRRILGVIYTGMEEHEKALEQNQLSQRVLKNWGLSSELLRAEIDAANMQIALGKYDEAINTLKGIVQQTEKDNSKRCLEIACGNLDKKETVSPIEVAKAYCEISMLYENMNEFETAISLLKRTLAILEKRPQEQQSEGGVSTRIGWLLLLKGEVPQAIPYLENAVEKLKDSFGSRHFGDILDVSLGPHQADSIETCQNLSKAYSAMGSYTLSIEFQQRVIDAWEGHGPSTEEELREARHALEELKTKARGTSTNRVPTKALPLPQYSLASRNSQPSIPLTQNSASSIR